MAKQSIESMYNIMFSMRKNMEDLLNSATELAAAARSYEGEISRVLTEQLSKYFAPAIKDLIENTNTPGSIQGLIRFLDSVPLAYTRIEPTMEGVAPVAPESVELANPAIVTSDDISDENIEPEPVDLEDSSVATEIDQLPANTSFKHPVEESRKRFRKSIREDLAHPEVKSWVVKRTSTVGSSLGEDVAPLEDEVVFNCDTKEEAEKKAEELNSMLKDFEKKAFGTEYVAEEISQEC